VANIATAPGREQNSWRDRHETWGE